MNSGITLLCCIAAIVAGWLWYRHDRKHDARKQFFQRFRVSRRSTIEDADTGQGHGAPDKRPLIADGLVGKPDAVFRHRGRITAGEYKNRRIGSRPRRRDLYQLMLYMGMLRSLNPSRTVDGRLVYNNRTFKVEFDPKLYQWLLGQRQPTLDLLRKFGR